MTTSCLSFTAKIGMIKGMGARDLAVVWRI
jgi:hypothetical protein